MKEIGSEFSLGASKEFYFNRINKFGKSHIFLRCGRDALGYIADLVIKRSRVILMPAYCCDSMVEPFVIRGWKIKYYPISKDLSVDIPYVINAYENYQPDCLLLMNFFGICNSQKTVGSIKIKCPSLQIIEDITHTLFDIEALYTEQVDYYIGSIRKWMGIIDGALIISTKTDMPGVLYVESEYVTLRRKGLNLKEEYHRSKIPSQKLIFRDILSAAEKSLNQGKTPYSISPDSKYMLYNLNVEPLRIGRKNNTNILWKLLNRIAEINYPENIEKILTITPFSIPILIKNRDYIQREMAKKGVYAAQLWPLSKDARNISPFAAEMEREMLSIPIDQRYLPQDMFYVYNVIRKSIYS